MMFSSVQRPVPARSKDLAAGYRSKPIGVFAVRQAAIGELDGRMRTPHIVDLMLSFTGVSAAKRAKLSFARTLW
jgi:hypothetical protein